MTKPLHRIREVMRRQEVTNRTLARHLGVGEAVARLLSVSSHDLTISQLVTIAKCLDCPPAELLVDSASDELVKMRAMVLRLARITNTIIAQAPTASVKALGESLRNMILDVMPQAAGTGELMAVGQRRSLDDLGRIALTPIHDPADSWGTVIEHGGHLDRV